VHALRQGPGPCPNPPQAPGGAPARAKYECLALTGQVGGTSRLGRRASGLPALGRGSTSAARSWVYCKVKPAARGEMGDRRRAGVSCPLVPALRPTSVEERSGIYPTGVCFSPSSATDSGTRSSMAWEVLVGARLRLRDLGDRAGLGATCADRAVAVGRRGARPVGARHGARRRVVVVLLRGDRGSRSRSSRKGALGRRPALAFQFASTNLVWELGLVLWILIGWQFTLAE